MMGGKMRTRANRPTAPAPSKDRSFPPHGPAPLCPIGTRRTGPPGIPSLFAHFFLNVSAGICSLAVRMNISIFGLGYVGAVTAGCLAMQGHRIIGVDVQLQKVDAFSAGIPPIIEPGLDDLFKTD